MTTAQAPIRSPERRLTEPQHEVLLALKINNTLVNVPATVQRRDLAVLTGLGDRRVRIVIKELRRLGYPIVSSSGMSGYWLTDDPAEVIDCLEHECLSRIRDLAATGRALRRTAAALQATIEGAERPIQGQLAIA
jgi:hypothetical protein